jgi:hypothetical protein
MKISNEEHTVWTFLVMHEYKSDVLTISEKKWNMASFFIFLQFLVYHMIHMWIVNKLFSTWGYGLELDTSDWSRDSKTCTDYVLINRIFACLDVDISMIEFEGVLNSK